MRWAGGVVFKCYTHQVFQPVEALSMRSLLKFVLIFAVIWLLYHFFGPQMDSLWEKTKTGFHDWVGTGTGSESSNGQEAPKYYPIDKRVQ
jgi:hypothetical protein